MPDDFYELRKCIIETYRKLALKPPSHRGEQKRRAEALETIKEEILDGRPLESFKAEHLEYLSLLVAYWRECEVEAGAPEPDELQ
jgi:hypothetical protein